jgi:hypothetical protein
MPISNRRSRSAKLITEKYIALFPASPFVWV